MSYNASFGYGSWDEAKQAILEKTREILAIGNEKGVEAISFRFEVDFNLMPIVTLEVRRSMMKEV